MWCIIHSWYTSGGREEILSEGEWLQKNKNKTVPGSVIVGDVYSGGE